MPCSLCGQSEAELIADRGQFGLPLFVSICRRDGLVYLTPRWTRERYRHFYAEEYDGHYRPQVLAQESEDERYASVRQVWSRLPLSRRAALSAVLDVGAGMGWSLQFVQRELAREVSLAAVEASEHCGRNIREIGAELLAEEIESDWHLENEERFDLVILRHTLEHTLDPVGVLRRIRAVLAPGGVAYIAVPDMLNPKGLLAEYWYRVVHTYYFSAPTLHQAIRLAGLEPILTGQENAELWCLVSPSTQPAPESFPSVYQDQLAALARYRRVEVWLRGKSVMKAITHPVRALLPARLRRAIRRAQGR